MPTQECAFTFVERLSRHVHPRTGGKVFCMVEAYMDESGIHDGAQLCVIAGYWGNVRKWKRFEQTWKQIIKDTGEPTLKEFHSTEFWSGDGSRKGIFAQWSDEKAERFINDLANCIVESNIFPTSAALVISDWDKLNKAERMALTGGYYDTAQNKWTASGAPNRKYFLPFQFAVVNPAIHCKSGLHVHYIFDLNKQFKHHAADLYALMRKDRNLECRHKLGALDFETGENAPGLQAADLLAYQSYKCSEIGKAKRPTRFSELPPLLKRLLTNWQDESDFALFDREGLNIALHDLPKELRSEGWRPVQPQRRRIL